MGSNVVNPAGLAAEIAEMVREYNADLMAAVPEVVDEVTRNALKDLKDRSPKLTREYFKGWRIRKVYSRDGFHGRVIYNKTDYQLTHLLEHGHAKAGGGRVPAYPHIAEVADTHGAQLEQDLTRLILNGGGR